MKCFFCKKDLSVSNNGHTYDCDDHKYIVCNYWEDKPEALFAYFTIKKEDACWMVAYYPYNKTRKFLLMDIYMGPDKRDIIELDFIPKITPDNFDEKIKSYLAFT